MGTIISQDDKLIKKAYAKVNYTKSQLNELRLCTDPITGPLYFMQNFMYVQHSIKGKQKFVPYPFQLDLIESYTHYKKSVNMVSRQMGKCLDKNTTLSIKNKTTGEVKTLTFEEFEHILKL